MYSDDRFQPKSAILEKHFFARCLLTFVVLVAIALPGFAQEDKSAERTEALNKAATEMEAVRSSLERIDFEQGYQDVLARAVAISTTADAVLAETTPELETVQTAIKALGTPSAGETADIKQERARLEGQRDQLDSLVKRAGLLAATARTTVEGVNRAATDLFNRNVLERVASPLTLRYWRALKLNFPVDVARLSNFFDAAWRNFLQSLTPRGILIIFAAFAIAALLAFPVRGWLADQGFRYASMHAPNTQARRSVLALWRALTGSLAYCGASLLIAQGLELAEALTPSASELVWTLAAAACFGVVVIAVASALLFRGKQSWRLLPIEDAAVDVLYPFPFVAALISLASVGIPALNRIVGASPAASVTANLAVSILHLMLLATFLLALRRLRRQQLIGGDELNRQRAMRSVAALLAWAAILAGVLAILSGHINLALLIGREMLWVAFIIQAAYLLMTAINDLCQTGMSEQSRFGTALSNGFGFRQSTIRQAGLIISAVVRVVVAFLALSATFAPLRGGTTPAYMQINSFTSIEIAGFVIRPDAVVRSAVILVVGFLLVRVVVRWLDRTYLPATELDKGTKNSTSTIVRYVGLALIVSWAIGALGIGMERLALLAGALSVGIGFGLQAITQNFISGVILLAERPIKVGDTIRVGTDEGDVKRINVRSTEIQIADRSTLIVPNSELVTKSVRNMTHANPIGRLQLQFAVPMTEDAADIARVLRKIFDAHPGVLNEPSPSVYIDSLQDDKINFNCFAFVASPRAAYSTKSELLFELLAQLRARGVSSSDIDTTPAV